MFKVCGSYLAFEIL